MGEAIPRRNMHFKDRARRAMVRLWDEAKQSHVRNALQGPSSKSNGPPVGWGEAIPRKEGALQGPSSKSNGPPVGWGEAIPLTIPRRMEACSRQPDGLSRTNAFQPQQPSYK
ncbi:hypothetical protein ACFQ3J_18535 [Paenibacillus provencensis]|uniref:Uncharacterized protein n=1 Tax=Paenibacillus provencensis TaxID=441151 RepID=A0ABW3Q413_9BACL|nr:hypothetical protein [Paenibacillus sp. MER 78]MCM3128243.1 hypothetical protein [Paenibacillus sp. MER 78]